VSKRTKTRYLHFCNYCGWEWFSSKERPKKCPKCTDPKWDEERE
jgi:rubrerythrin